MNNYELLYTIDMKKFEKIAKQYQTNVPEYIDIRANFNLDHFFGILSVTPISNHLGLTLDELLGYHVEMEEWDNMNKDMVELSSQFPPIAFTVLINEQNYKKYQNGEML